MAVFKTESTTKSRENSVLKTEGGPIKLRVIRDAVLPLCVILRQQFRSERRAK